MQEKTNVCGLRAAASHSETNEILGSNDLRAPHGAHMPLTWKSLIVIELGSIPILLPGKILSCRIQLKVSA